MRFGVSVPPGGSVADLVATAVAADRAGWDGFFLWDHVYIDKGLPVYDPWVLLGAMATATTHVRLGAMVTPLARRRPWKVAKEITTLDHLSRGRAVVGVGLGAPDADFTAFGETADPSVRAQALDTNLALLDGFLRGEQVDRDGVSARLTPGCVQSPRPPIWVAATWPRRRPLARAARYDGVFLAAPISPAEVREVRAVVGPAADIVLPLAGPVPELTVAGVTWLIAGPGSPDGDWLGRLRATVDQGPPINR